MKRYTLLSIAVAALVAGAAHAGPAQAGVVGGDAAACSGGEGAAILANIVGLKDRAGEVKLELYPATEGDFLQDDNVLVAQHKLFRRIVARTPQTGPVAICIRVPGPGRYAILFTHNRDNKAKFDFWSDGAGFPSNQRLGMSRPKLAQAVITAGPGVTQTTIRAQYLRGLRGFGPVND